MSVRRLVLVVALLVMIAWATPARAQETVEYYATDHLGSVRVVFTASGTVISRADYLPYGEEVLAPTGPLPAERFTGQARDAEAGQDYFHSRMYQPRTGRFNAVDPVYAGLFDPQQWNRYAYARNSPLVITDPTGLYNQPTTPVCQTSVSSYSCPSGGLVIPLPNYVPSDDPYEWGYHGGESAAAEQQYAADRNEKFWAGVIDNKVPTNKRYERETDAVIAANPTLWLATENTGWEWAKNIFYDPTSASFALGTAFTSQDPLSIHPIDIQFNVTGDSNYRPWVGIHHTHPSGNPALTQLGGDTQYAARNGVAIFAGTSTQINGFYPTAWTGSAGRFVTVWPK